MKYEELIQKKGGGYYTTTVDTNLHKIAEDLYSLEHRSEGVKCLVELNSNLCWSNIPSGTRLRFIYEVYL